MASKSWLTIGAELCQVLSLIVQVVALGWVGSVAVIPNTIPTILAIFSTVLGLVVLVSAYRWRVQRMLSGDKAGKEGFNRTLLSVMVIAGLIMLNLIFFVFRQSPTTSLRILVTDFAEMQDSHLTVDTVSQFIYDRLQESVGDQTQVEILRISNSVEGLTSRSAKKLGQDYSANIVIWGWYAKRESLVYVYPHFEVLGTDTIFLPFNPGQRIVPRESFESFDFEIELSNDFSDLTAFTIGSIRKLQNRNDDAISAFSSVVAAGNSKLLAEALDQRGLTYLDLGQTDKAIADFHNAIALEPEDPFYNYDLGIAKIQATQYDEAILNLNRSTQLFPDFSSAYAILGIAYSKQGLNELAEENFEKAIQIRPSLIQYRWQLADHYLGLQKFSLAEKQLDYALESDPTNSTSHFLLGQLNYSQGKILPALAQFVLFFFFLNPLLSVLSILAGFILIAFYLNDRKQNGKISNRIFEKVLIGMSQLIFWIFKFDERSSKTVDNKIVTALLAFGIRIRVTAYVLADCVQDAILLIENAIKRGIRRTYLINKLGLLYLWQGDSESAIKWFSEILKQYQGDGFARFGLGRAYETSGELRKALKQYSLVKSSRNLELETLLRMSVLYWNYTKEIHGMLALLKRAVRKNAKLVIKITYSEMQNPFQISNAALHLKLGLAYEELGDLKKAAAGFELCSRFAGYSRIGAFARSRLHSTNAEMNQRNSIKTSHYL